MKTAKQSNMLSYYLISVRYPKRQTRAEEKNNKTTALKTPVN